MKAQSSRYKYFDVIAPIDEPRNRKSIFYWVNSIRSATHIRKPKNIVADILLN